MVLALAAGLMTVTAASAEQVPDENFPNLPARRLPAVSPLLSSNVSNLAYVGPSKQWVQLVDVKVTATVDLVVSTDASCAEVFGAGSPRCVNDRPDGSAKFPLRGKAYPVSFEGSDPGSPPADISELRRFGAEFSDFPAQRIRLLAFGAVPAEATLALSLAKDSGGLPIGIQLDADDYYNRDLTDTAGTGRLQVSLSDVSVDGQSVDVGGACRLTEPAILSVIGRGYRFNLDAPQSVPEGAYNPNFGGLLEGSLSVGTFAGCGTGGEDLSPLINSMAANTEVPVRIVQGEVNDRCFTDKLRVAISDAFCDAPGELEYPVGGQLPEGLPQHLPAPSQD